MADTLKTFFSPSLVRRLAADLARVHPDFPVARFVKDACAGLDALELLDRGRHIARVLAANLPQSYPEAIETGKVFKIARLVLAPRTSVQLKTSLSLKVYTTRVPQPGTHAVDVLVNGQAMQAGSFDVIDATTGARKSDRHSRASRRA